MAPIISDKFRIFNAKQFLESLTEGSTDSSSDRSKMYFFLGRPERWYSYLEIYSQSNVSFEVNETVYIAGGTPGLQNAVFKGKVAAAYPNSLLLYNIGPTVNALPVNGSTLIGNTSTATCKVGIYRFATDEIPSVPFDNQEDKYTVYDDMIAMKRVTSAYGRPVIRRYDYDPIVNPIFDIWRPDYSVKNPSATGATALKDAKYFCRNRHYEVFVCLRNANGVNVTYEPKTSAFLQQGEGTYDSSTGVYTEPNGNYSWKYLYTIPTDDVIRFLSTDFMPICTYNGTSIVDGAISTVLIRDAGSGWPQSSIFYSPIRGDGSGGKVKITTNGSGVISAVEVTSSGSDYSYAGVVIDPAYIYTTNDLSTLATGVTNVQGDLDVIIPPQGGHGYDLISELNSKRVMLNVRLTYAEGQGDFPIDNDFRRIGIVADPLVYQSSSALLSDTAQCLYAVKLNNVSGDFIQDETITQTVSGGNAFGTVVSWVLDENSTTSGVLKYFQGSDYHRDSTGVVRRFQSNGANAVSAPVELGGSGISGSVDITYDTDVLGVNFENGIALPEVQPRSGEILYLENRRTISRAPDQIEDIKLVIEF
jgi:hypothetical protein